MEEIDDIAPLVHYNMLLSSLPMDKRGHEDFGAYLRADENIHRRRSPQLCPIGLS